MTTIYGMPFFLEDKTGRLDASEFVDIYQRMRYSLRCTLREAEHTAYMVYDITSTSTSSRGGLMVPVATFDYGANQSLGMIKVGEKQPVQIDRFLSKVSPRNSKTRKFVASDNQEYRWVHQPSSDTEWQCTNANGYSVAAYSLKLSGEPAYPSSSGCTLTVEENFANIAGELLVTLLIMRHIAKYNL